MRCKKGLAFVTMAILIVVSSSQIIPSNGLVEILPVPREESIIYYAGSNTNFESFNYFIPGGCPWLSGYQMYIIEWDWYYDHYTGNITLWKTTGWEYSDNYTTLIYHIRPGVKWNDGVPYTAEDYVFTWQMLKDNPELLGHEEALYVESVEAIDNYTVVYHLKQPNPRAHWIFCQWGGRLGK